MATASAPLLAPLHRASFGQAVSRFFRAYAAFRGRASKSEFWWVALFLFVITLVPNAMVTAGLASGLAYSFAHPSTVSVGSGDVVGYAQPPLLDDPTAAALLPPGLALGGVLFAALVVPTLALIWRRLHDAGLVGPWFFTALLPAVGPLFLAVLMLQPTKREARRFDVPA